MADSVMRQRVERLIHGDFNPEDLTRLFVFLRDKHLARQSVQEIGHFVAHQGERDKGFTTDAARRFFASLRFEGMLCTNGRVVDFRDLPLNFKDILRDRLQTLQPTVIKKATQFNAGTARRVFKGAMDKVVAGGTGRLLLIAPLTADEEKIVRCLAGSYIVKPAFNDLRLTNELAYALIGNDLLKHSHQKKLFAKSHRIALYVLALMHRSEIVLDSAANDRARLLLSGGREGLSIYATASFLLPTMPNVNIAGPLFVTNLTAAQWCEEPLASALLENTPPVADWGIEATPAERLAKI